MVYIITDTTSGLPADVAEKYHIPVIPQVVNFGNESFLEGREMDIAAFIQRLRIAPELPKTAAPPPDLFAQEFARLVPTGEPILCLHPSAEVSGTVRSATVAAADFPGADIRVIDTRSIASPLATLVELAAQWAAGGASADEIEQRLRAMLGRVRIYFLVATLDFLARGGRIGGAAALVGSLLQIKPILTFREGKVDQFERERTYRRAFSRLAQIAIEQMPHDESAYPSVMHAGVPEEAQRMAAELAAASGISRIPILNLPPAIVTHGGPGMVGIGFFVKG